MYTYNSIVTGRSPQHLLVCFGDFTPQGTAKATEVLKLPPQLPASEAGLLPGFGVLCEDGAMVCVKKFGLKGARISVFLSKIWVIKVH